MFGNISVRMCAMIVLSVFGLATGVFAEDAKDVNKKESVKKSR